MRHRLELRDESFGNCSASTAFRLPGVQDIEEQTSSCSAT